MFFAMMSHEMRTPLTACIGMAQILLETTTLDQKQRECAQSIEGSGNTLLSIINDILDLSKMQVDKITLEKIPFSVRDCIEQSISIVQSKAEEKGLELIAFISAQTPALFMGDSNRLKQVLLNLLSNAIKFTSQGSVTLECEYVLEETAMIHFAVVDTGIGLSETTIAQLFRPFTQADATTARRFGGTGLGLSISKRLVEMMGGSLQVTSVGEGHGCKFWFDLPCAPVSYASIRHRRHDSVHIPLTAKALVVDPHTQRRAATVELLNAIHVNVEEIANANELTEEHGSDTVIVVQNYSGFYDSDEMRKLRKGFCSDGSFRQIILIAKMKEFASGQGSDVVWVSQPLTLQKLKGAFADALQVGQNTSSASGPAKVISSPRKSVVFIPPDVFKDYSVLVVDDVVLNQRVLSLKLQQFGFHKIDFASSGMEALEHVRKADPIYDLVLMDIMMPGHFHF